MQSSPPGRVGREAAPLFSIDEVKWGQQIEKIIGILASYVFFTERRTEPGCFKAAKRQRLRLNTLQWSTVLILQSSQAFKGLRPCRDGEERQGARGGASQKHDGLVVEMCVGEMCERVTGSEVIRRLIFNRWSRAVSTVGNSCTAFHLF